MSACPVTDSAQHYNRQMDEALLTGMKDFRKTVDDLAVFDQDRRNMQSIGGGRKFSLGGLCYYRARNV